MIPCLQEECRGWDVNEVVFGPAMWPTYHSLMRADFTLFDEYKYQHAGKHTLHAHPASSPVEFRAAACKAV